MHPRGGRSSRTAASDMSPGELIWFARAPTFQRIKGSRGRSNPMLWTRRAAMTGCCGALAGLAARPAVAEAAYPNRTIKMIVPYPAGGTIDLLGRLVADQLRVGLARHRRRREQAGSGHRAWRRTGGAFGSRRLHAPDRDIDHACHQQGAVPQIGLRSSRGFHPDCPGRAGAVCPDRQSIPAGEDADGIHGLRQRPIRGSLTVRPATAVHIISVRKCCGNGLESTSITCPIAAAFRRCLTSSRAVSPSWWWICSRRCRKFATERSGCWA